MRKLFFYLSILTLIGSACNQTAPVISLKRASVSKNPIQEYSEKIPDPLNDWYFKVQLFETDSTFNYRIKMQYKEVIGEQLIRFPNLGYTPQPALKKGEYDHTVLVGFLNDKGEFMNYKMVYVLNDQLGIHGLKRYTFNP
jgi:hypothetical protein